ncbi:hypothetical protein DESUT3_10890 [Desulfuromonas versatilis]|uniref:Uncharacterized protein n=1 Tax=Desulfuromonas versatilis TaxID=2802975 RepID=A0ABM8HPP8_9BACT|nr:hypothetical protein [Desulfuromonas versatilis]BCR04020.1 hypothetical protein DESUT3_10890 [Desulfuromonas versatilis]
MGDQGKIREVPFAERAAVRSEVRQEIEAVRWLLEAMRERLPAQSATAKAIERRAPWREILQFARWEECFEVAGLLEDAIATLEDDIPPEVLG